VAAWALTTSFLGVAALALACGSDSANQAESEVLAAYSCPEQRCVDVEVALDTLGHSFLEPATLPQGFGLHSRTLSQDAPAPGVPAGSPAYSVYEEFRFQGSLNLPGILVIQSWPFAEGEVRIQPQDESCGGLESSAVGPIYYAAGLVRVLPVPEQALWLVCLDETAGHEQTHYVVTAANGGLIEIVAFPESGVTKDEVIALVDSLLPVAATAD
jgi:hypothetical protein